jgi:hypothetical protein
MPFLQLTPLPKLHPLIFGLTAFGWLHSVTQTLISDKNIIFYLCIPDLCPLFQEYN